ncbi:MAG: amidohydrolase family protein [Pseudomonadota bacterium]
MFDNDTWLNQVQEDALDPDREIVDPHHHLWEGPQLFYSLSDLHKDTGSGHKIVQTVFMECGASYDRDAPDAFAPVGETRFVTRAAKASAEAAGDATIAAIIGHADLTSNELDAVLDAHIDASNGLFRGIRHAGAWDPEPDALRIKPRGREGQYLDSAFQAGVARLGERGLTYDTWHYHHQNRDFLELAKAVPDTTIILDHFGSPLGVGRFAGKRAEIFEAWKDDVAAIAECSNVYAKLGGMAMPDNGFGWDTDEVPPNSDRFVEAQAAWYHHMIACFGPSRCMFESNFPVDRWSIGYGVLWNGLKKIASAYSEDEKDAMFSGTARRVYTLPPL